MLFVINKQWGRNYSQDSITYPINFNKVYAELGIHTGEADEGNINVAVSELESTTNSVVFSDNHGSKVSVYWFAIGS